MATQMSNESNGINGASLAERAAAARARRGAEGAQRAARRAGAVEAAAQILTERLLAALGSEEMREEMARSADASHPSCFLTVSRMQMPTREMGQLVGPSHLELTRPGADGQQEVSYVSYVELLVGPLDAKTGKPGKMPGGTVLDRVNRVLKEEGNGVELHLQYRKGQETYRVSRVVGQEKDAEGRQRDVYQLVLDADGRPREARVTNLVPVVVWEPEEYQRQQQLFEERQAARQAERQEQRGGHRGGHQGGRAGGQGGRQQGGHQGQGQGQGRREMTLAEYQAQQGRPAARAAAPVRQQRPPEEIEAGYAGRQGQGRQGRQGGRR